MSPDFSIIVATLGRPTLFRLLQAIEDSSVTPSRVILSLPRNSKFLLNCKDFSFDILIIKESNGQVSQRFATYPHIHTPFVIQLDDDVFFEPHFLSSLLERFLLLPTNSILAPSLYNCDLIRSSLVYPKPFLSSLLYFIASFKFRPTFGCLTSSGYPVGFSLLQPRYLDTEFIPVEWCPGACIVHHTSNLLPYNYYKQDGKAYAEDLVHCICLSKNNIRTYIDPTLKVQTFDESIISPNQFIHFLRSRKLLYQSLIIHDVPFNKLQFHLFSFVYCISRLLSVIFKPFNV